MRERYARACGRSRVQSDEESRSRTSRSPPPRRLLFVNHNVPFERVVANENAACVRECLGHLRDLDRQTLVAFYFEGRSLQEMSADFDSPVGTIKRRLHTARNRLRDKLSDLQLVG